MLSRSPPPPSLPPSLPPFLSPPSLQLFPFLEPSKPHRTLTPFQGNVHFEDVVRRVSVGDLPGDRGGSALGAGAAAAAAASTSGAAASTEAESQAEVLQMFRKSVQDRGARGIIG